MTWLLCLALAGQQTAALAALPCAHDAMVAVPAHGTSDGHGGHSTHGVPVDDSGTESPSVSHEGHAMHGGADEPDVRHGVADPHAGHTMHVSTGPGFPADLHAAVIGNDPSECDCGCAAMACVQNASSLLPHELTFAKSIPPSDSPAGDAVAFVPDRERATLLRPPIAA